MAVGSIEYAVFPMAVMRITTKMGVGTHVNSFAIDLAGKDSGKDWAFAPFTGVIKKKYSNGNTVWLESINPVKYADGTIDYMTVAMTHDDNINDLKVGQIINQGVNFYQEGTAGNASGNHIHLGVGRGRFTGTGWFQNKQGYWVINNEIPPYDAFYISGTQIINNGGYPWKEIESYMTKEEIMVVYKFATVGDKPTQYHLKAWTGRPYGEYLTYMNTDPSITKRQKEARTALDNQGARYEKIEAYRKV